MKLLTLARDLRRRKAREKHALFVAEGARSVEELLRSSIVPIGILAAPKTRESDRATAILAAARERQIVVEEIDDREFASAAETDSPQGILAIARVPESRLEHLPDTVSIRLLILDAVQDPGNVGTIVRTAAALGATATSSLPGTVDLWNAKVVRSGMGAHFHHPCLSGTWDELDTFRRARSVEIWAADAAGMPIDAAAPPARLGLIVGNEGAGLSSSSRERADTLVALPIASTVESLNVAVAAGILLFELRS